MTTRPKARLKNLYIKEIAGVYRGAQGKQPAVIMKRRAETTTMLVSRVVKMAVLTDEIDGHAHTIDLDDPADRWCDSYSTSYQTAAGADDGHSHAWTYDPATGAVTIAADSGHGHAVTALVPADVRAAAAVKEAAERQRRAAATTAAALESAAGGGVTVAVTVDPIEMRAAPDAAATPISTPSPTTETVKSQETSMTTELEKIADLEKRCVRFEKMSTLTDAQRVHFAKLTSNDAELFLAMRTDQRDGILAEIAKADEVVYTSLAGREYRKSAPLEIIEAVKTSDAAKTMIAETAIAKKNFEYAKRGDETLTNFAKGVKGDLRARIVKALDTEFKDPAEYEEAIRALKGADVALKELTLAKGYTPDQGAATDASPQAQLDALVAKHAQEKGVPIAKAYAAVLETAAGAGLYKQIPTARA